MGSAVASVLLRCDVSCDHGFMRGVAVFEEMVAEYRSAYDDKCHEFHSEFPAISILLKTLAISFRALSCRSAYQGRYSRLGGL